MFFSTSVIAVALTSLVSVNAQTYWTINPDDIDLGTKQIWCSNQISACTLLCLDQQSGGGFTNDCWVEDLSYQCICADNTVPNATEYSQTIPYFICRYQVENCVQNCGPSDPTCAQVCKSGKTCGASNPSRVTSSASSAPASKTSSSKPTGSNDDDDAAFDSQPTDDATPSDTQSDDDAAVTSGDSKSQETNKPNAAARLSSIGGSTMAFSIMMLSVACGAFVFQL